MVAAANEFTCMRREIKCTIYFADMCAANGCFAPIENRLLHFCVHPSSSFSFHEAQRDGENAA